MAFSKSPYHGACLAQGREPPKRPILYEAGGEKLGVANGRFWPRVEFFPVFVLNELHRFLLVGQNRVEMSAAGANLCEK
jgi:hypothetical protein